MKAAYIQFDVSHKKEENFRTIERFLSGFSGGLAVLPELSLCGYLFPDREALMAAAEPVPAGPSVRKMQALSERYHCVIVFGLAEKEGNTVYNTAAVVGNGRYLGKYRKVHLSDLEKKYFACGTSNRVIDTGEYRLGVQICFDLWFPEISREQIRQGAEILCAPANFGGETTAQIARIRAIENLTPLILCNRVGREFTPEIDACFLGKSAIWNGAGEQMGQSQADSERMEVCRLKPGRKSGNIICRDFDAERNRHPLPLTEENH